MGTARARFCPRGQTEAARLCPLYFRLRANERRGNTALLTRSSGASDRRLQYGRLYDYIHIFPCKSYFYLDDKMRSFYIRSQPRSSKGVVRRHPEGGARRGVLRRRLWNRRPGRQGLPPGTTTRTWEFAMTDPAPMPARGSAAPAPKI